MNPVSPAPLILPLAKALNSINFENICFNLNNNTNIETSDEDFVKAASEWVH